MPTFRGFSYFVMKVKVPVLILFILLAVPSFVAKDRIDFAYGSSEIYGDASTQIGADAIRINEEFGRSNQIVCMVPRGDTAREKALSDAFKTIPERRCSAIQILWAAVSRRNMCQRRSGSC